jgi:hypothetical protein
MVWLTDIKNQQKIAVNPRYVVVVFTATEQPQGIEDDVVGKTVLGMVTGNVIVEEPELEVVTALNGG